MGKIVKTTDFIDEYAITQNQFNTHSLQAFIDKYELLYLYDLLGIELGGLLYSDIAPSTFLPPVTTRFTTLFNSIYDDNDNSLLCGQIRSEGIKIMLKGFIYWEFIKSQKVKNTITGNIVGQNEVSREALPGESNMYDNYNKAIDTYKSIQRYIDKNSSAYPEYNGINKQYANHII